MPVQNTLDLDPKKVKSFQVPEGNFISCSLLLQFIIISTT